VKDQPVYRRGDVLWRRTYDRVVLLLPTSGQFLTLQATACELWAAVEEPGSVSALAERLAAVYEAPVEQIASDIEAVLGQLTHCGALVVTDTPR
jgi:hypothetical protein